MKVKCIDRKGAEEGLTMNKVYEVSSKDTVGDYYLVDDRKKPSGFFAWHFQTVADDACQQCGTHH